MIDTLLSTLPVFGICGNENSGKTRLIEQLIPRFIADGLDVAVIKHDTQGIDIDSGDKETDQLFRSGATVFLYDPEQSFIRQKVAGNNEMFINAVDFLVQDHDLILVEGNSRTPLPVKLWLRDPSGNGAPTEAGLLMATLDSNVDRPTIAYELITRWLLEHVRSSPVWGGLLIGGRSSRLGRPKHLIQTLGETWAERIAKALYPHVAKLCIIGAGDVPVGLADCPHLPDVPDRSGPISGMLAAMRWQPRVSWVFAACDMPGITPEAVAWLVDQRIPGRWAILPRQAAQSPVEPFLAFYDFRTRGFLETTDKPYTLVDLSKTFTPQIPFEHQRAWDNLNTLGEAKQWPVD